ncbi:diacylglycerol kinase [Candidatus Gottesmanbacteria bacterium RIFCSPLOWO2_01_FULL_46_9]|uniref:Dihydrofolate reductase n=1 Tax=Candidatus Gottesmanbacteria bacterium RIFCSPLOWO2_01_FULL_46_9 TaxID=1798394 RepID=A0A1F6B2Y1_9BACT|nr:MAG: diacylglycerol kinase [Candidatus Gottesmanbacteria bacterium RIFCSPLOWO2_01_FULL_46_9]
MLSIIAVIGRNRELGKDNKLLWHIPGDLPRFKQITSGHPVIMGRKTFQSIGRPLPGRVNFVITADSAFKAEGVTVVSSLDEAIEQAKSALGGEEMFVIGGGSVYAQAIDRADRLYLTIVDAEAQADTFFPDYSRFGKVIFKEEHEAEGYRFTYLTLAQK